MTDEKLGVEESVVKDILGKDAFDDLLQWYDYILQEKWEYVVFLARRSYVLALICESLDEKRMEDRSRAVFLTDASAILWCNEFAEKYRMFGRFPKILLCDDVLIHGRNINRYITNLESRLCALLETYGCNPKDIRNALIETLEIHVCVRNKQPLLLLGDYGLNLHYVSAKEVYLWREFSDAVSTLILRSNISNACYIFSEYISDRQFEKIALDDYVYTVFQGTEQYTRCQFVRQREIVRAIMTVRIVKNVDREGYRVIPFVFLPNLREEETVDLLEMIQTKKPCNELWNQLTEWKEIEGKRSFSELITLIFSVSVLRNFNKQNKIRWNLDDKNKEIYKLARNYNWCGLESSKQLIEYIVNDESFCFTNEEMKTGFLKCLAMTNYRVLETKDDWEQRDILNAHKIVRIRRRVEDYFYAKGCEDETDAIELMNLPYYSTQRRIKRYSNGCCFVLDELNRGYNVEETKYCVAFVQQMMDAGVLALSSYAMYGVQVNGFSQFAKTGEQALLIGPLRIYLYIPMLAQMQAECEKRDLDFRDELSDYCESNRSQLFEKPEDEKEMFDILDKMERINQTPKEWNGGFLRRVDYEHNSLTEMIRFAIKQEKLRKKYIEYVDEKYY